MMVVLLSIFEKYLVARKELDPTLGYEACQNSLWTLMGQEILG